VKTLKGKPSKLLTLYSLLIGQTEELRTIAQSFMHLEGTHASLMFIDTCNLTFSPWEHF